MSIPMFDLGSLSSLPPRIGCCGAPSPLHGPNGIDLLIALIAAILLVLAMSGLKRIARRMGML